MGTHLYFGEENLKKVSFETPLVKSVRKSLATYFLLFSGIFLILGAALFTTYYFLFYKNTFFALTGIGFVIYFLQGLFTVTLFAESKKENSFYKANSIGFLVAVQVIKAVFVALLLPYMLFFQYRRFILVRYIKVKLLLPAVAFAGLIFVAIIISIIALLKIKATAVNNIPKKSCSVITAVWCFAAGVIGILLTVGSVAWEYAQAVLLRHTVFLYSNYVFIPLGLFFISLQYIFTGIVFIKYCKAVKKGSK